MAEKPCPAQQDIKSPPSHHNPEGGFQHRSGKLLFPTVSQHPAAKVPAVLMLQKQNSPACGADEKQNQRKDHPHFMAHG